jgi:peptidylprolyl isomerase domain and WD repeat-containing protein 1
MHREIVNNIIVSSKVDVVITFSLDGHIKFWKKVFHLVEFLKNFKAHTGLIICAALSKNHDALCTAGIDKTVKIFDVLSCDLRNVIRLAFTPSACEFLPRKGFDLPLIAISEEKSCKITII